MGFDDRVKRKSKPDEVVIDEPLPQLQGHTKTYTKVVLEQRTDILGDQPAEALIGKCVKVFITGAQKWHISGKIIDASPAPDRAPTNYFEKLEAKRKEELLKQFQADETAMESSKALAGHSANTN